MRILVVEDEKYLAEALEQILKKNKYTVNVPLLNVRTGPGLKYDKLSFADFTEEIQSKILKRRGEPEDAVVEGTEIDVTEIKENWGKTNMGWICLDYCKKTGA